ncbi:MAG: Snf7 family protein [Promethearchaeota archaeon]|jgi:division protein CdvB (Snf7/Vps24/ESCRT-III family)
MSAIRRFMSWLGGGPDLKKLIFRLDVFCRKLDLQRKMLEKEASKSRQRAKKYRLQGNMDATRMYLQHHLRFQKWALSVDAYRLRIEGLQTQLRQSEAMGEVAKILGQLNSALGGLKNQVKVPEVAKLVDQIEGNLRHFEMTQEVAEAGMERMAVSTEVTDGEVKDALRELDSEIEVETGTSLPEPEKRVSELEKEIERLKEEG